MSAVAIDHSPGKSASGRGVAVIVYGLLLGSILTLVTAPLGAALACLWRRRSAAWVATHLRFQIATVCWAVAGLLLGGVLWWWLGRQGLAAEWAWTLGYAVFTAQLAWLVGRCAFGLHRLTSNRPVGNLAVEAR
ncbi:hypothetical protein [Parahaliea mediterranea]|uniref:DUF4870 domain-containing protein n=1 Tax=Parahaliea mediterranea TaxID=651086 RepID=A0A939DFF9_9GAMM|nr:hypothetical protein [Parahaliea mediterranea]MBN7796527.1 hypothetical protein [Parahaliea mediterranea]